MILTTVVYKLLLESCYIAFISPKYESAKMFLDPIPYKFILSILAVLFCLFVFTTVDSVSTRIVKLIFLTTIVPLFSFYWLANKSDVYFFYIFISFILLTLITNKFRFSISIDFFRNTAHNKKSEEYYLNLLLLLATVLSVYLLINNNGIELGAFNFENTYIIREEKELTGISIYLFNWLTKAILPFLMIVFIYKNSTIRFLISVLLQVLAFLYSSNKAVLFVIPFLFAMYLLLKLNIWYEGIALLYFIGTWLTSVFYALTSKLMPLAIFPLRFLVMPAQISNMYYDFFSQNEKLFFRETIFGRVLGLESPYPMKAAILLSPGQSKHYNTGILGDAYSNAGLLGMIIIVVLLSIILIFIESITNSDNQPKIFTLFICYYAIVWNDMALLTSLLTGGGLIMILLVIIYSRLCANRTLDRMPILPDSIGD